jgi:hypothetical protein
LVNGCLNRKKESLEALGAAVERGSNTVERFNMHRRLGLRSLADDPQYHGRLDDLIQKAQSRITIK